MSEQHIAHLGSTPCEEECSQVGSDDYHGREECERYRTLLLKKFAEKHDRKPNCRLLIVCNDHDLGEYHELVAKGGEDVYWFDDNAPAHWED